MYKQILNLNTLTTIYIVRGTNIRDEEASQQEVSCNYFLFHRHFGVYHSSGNLIKNVASIKKNLINRQFAANVLLDNKRTE